jgi:hypothetical protein
VWSRWGSERSELMLSAIVMQTYAIFAIKSRFGSSFIDSDIGVSITREEIKIVFASNALTH